MLFWECGVKIDVSQEAETLILQHRYRQSGLGNPFRTRNLYQLALAGYIATVYCSEAPDSRD